MRASLARHALLLPLLAGALLLAISEFLTLREIRVITASPAGSDISGGSHHAYGLLIIAIALAVMAFGAVRGGSRPAAVGCVVLAAAAVFIVLAIDLPEVSDEGIYARTYELAEARPQIGFYLESLGAALALVGAVALLLLGRSEPAEREPRSPEPRERPRREPRTAD